MQSTPHASWNWYSNGTAVMASIPIPSGRLRKVIAEVGDPDLDDEPGDEELAIANLLAASPDLLRCLLECRRAIEWSATHQNGNVVQCNECLKMIDQAVAKAGFDNSKVVSSAS